jgi:hypothetical protein
MRLGPAQETLMVPHSLLLIYKLKAAEYVLSVVYLFCFAAFWRFIHPSK